MAEVALASPAADQERSRTTRSFAYWMMALLWAWGLAEYSTSRDVFGDIQVYYRFYDMLAKGTATSIAIGCSSFEPGYCGGSYIFRHATGSAANTHLAWVAAYYLITFAAIRDFWLHFFGTRRVGGLFMLVFMFVALNYVEPQQISYLVRQYVASALVMFGLGRVVVGRNPLLWCVLAMSIHFGSAPICALIILAHRGLPLKWLLVGAIGAIAIYLSNSYLFELYFESIKYKFGEYQSKFDGDVTIVQEIKILLYLSLCVYTFRNYRKIALIFILSYVFYLCTFPISLLHLRYYKYLEVLVWPSVFALAATPLFRRFDRACLLAAVSSIRLYRYVSVLGDGYGLPVLLKAAAASFSANVLPLFAHMF